ncbi:MAG: DUF4834 family protein [Paraprevotella sp.]|nr:DUF4834 family protein [Paraprevotella sp.]
MGNTFGCLLGFVFAVLALPCIAVLNILGKVKKKMSSFSPKGGNSSQAEPHKEQGYQKSDTTSAHGHNSHKIFDDDEGEYVDFEDIK